MESRAGSSPLRRRCSRVWQRCRQLGEIYRSLTLGVDQLESVSSPLILQQRGPRSPSERDVQALNCSVQHPRWEGRSCAHLCGTQTPCCTELALDRFLPFFFFFSPLSKPRYLTCFHGSTPMPRIFISHLQGGRILEGYKAPV